MNAALATRNLQRRRREAYQTLVLFRLPYRYMRLAIIDFARRVNTRKQA